MDCHIVGRGAPFTKVTLWQFLSACSEKGFHTFIGVFPLADREKFLVIEPYGNREGVT